MKISFKRKIVSYNVEKMERASGLLQNIRISFSSMRVTSNKMPESYTSMLGFELQWKGWITSIIENWWYLDHFEVRASATSTSNTCLRGM